MYEIQREQEGGYNNFSLHGHWMRTSSSCRSDIKETLQNGRQTGLPPRKMPEFEPRRCATQPMMAPSRTEHNLLKRLQLFIMIDIAEYKVGEVLDLEGCGGKKTKCGKALKACKVNIGDKQNPILVVTSASNVRMGSRVVVALAGSNVLNEEGEEIKVTKMSVGGVMSEGMLCDSRMLLWSGGGHGVAAVMPDSFAIGSAPPEEKPRPKEPEPEPEPKVEVKGLFEKKLTKEEKKKLAEERRAARKAAKEAKKAAEAKQ